jgi:hypothetical protein
LIGYLVAGAVVGTNGVAAHVLAPSVVSGTLVLNIFGRIIFTERNSKKRAYVVREEESLRFTKEDSQRCS